MGPFPPDRYTSKLRAHPLGQEHLILLKIRIGTLSLVLKAMQTLKEIFLKRSEIGMSNYRALDTITE